jgi:hypothetical protein
MGKNVLRIFYDNNVFLNANGSTITPIVPPTKSITFNDAPYKFVSIFRYKDVINNKVVVYLKHVSDNSDVLYFKINIIYKLPKLNISTTTVFKDIDTLSGNTTINMKNFMIECLQGNMQTENVTMHQIENTTKHTITVIKFEDFQVQSVMKANTTPFTEVSASSSAVDTEVPEVKYEATDSVFFTTTSTKASVNISVLSPSTSTIIKNCKRKSGGNEVIDVPSPSAMQQTLAITLSYVMVGFIFILALVHLLTKGPETDFWGYPIQYTGLSGGMPNNHKMAGGEYSFLKNDYINVNFPKPDWSPYLKLNSFLFFLSALIFGMTVRVDYVLVSIIVLFAMCIYFVLYKQEYSFTNGMNILSLLMYDKESVAKYFAIVSYWLFYTSFLGLVNRSIGEPGFIMLMFNFVAFTGFTIYSSINNIVKILAMQPILFLGFIVVANMFFSAVIINQLRTQENTSANKQ